MLTAIIDVHVCSQVGHGSAWQCNIGRRQSKGKYTCVFPLTTACDLHAATPGISMDKYAYYTYLIIRACNADSCAAESSQVSVDGLCITENQAIHCDSTASRTRTRTRRVNKSTGSNDR